MKKPSLKIFIAINTVISLYACQNIEKYEKETYFTMPQKMTSDEQKAYDIVTMFQDLALQNLGNDFKIDARVRFVDDIIVNGEKPSAGLCSYKEQPFTVQLNKSLWTKANDVQKELLLLHELGHCVLDRRHTEGRRPDGGPKSIMNLNIQNDSIYYIENKKFYLKEFFNNTPFQTNTVDGFVPSHSRLFLERH